MFKKIRNLFMSNVNDAVDKLTRADKMLKYSIVRMENELEKAREGLVTMMVNKKVLERNKAKADAQVKELEGRIKSNINDEQRAMALIKQRMETEKLVSEYIVQIEKQSKYIEQMKKQIQNMDVKIEITKNKKDILLARKSIAEMRNVVYKDIKVDEKLFDTAEEKIEYQEIYADVAEENYEVQEFCYSEDVKIEYEKIRGKV